MKIAIIGAGYSGMSIAKELAKDNEIVMFEKEKEVGGMVSTFEVANTRLEKYYRHIFKSDKEVIELVEDLKLSDKLIWPATKMGYLVNKKMYAWGTPISLLQFKELNFIEKMRFGFNVVHLKLINDYKKLEKCTAEEWFTKRIGNNIYSKIWEPLLISKFGDKKKDISMAWMWGKIKLRSTSSSMEGENLGYIEGSYQALTDALYKYLLDKKVKIELETPIEKIEKEKDKYKIVAKGNTYEGFDIVVSTVNYDQSYKLLKKYVTKEEKEKMQAVEYTAARTMVMVTDKSFGPYYWLNIGDNDIPFGGIIEHTNFIKEEKYENKHIIYISNYMSKENKLYSYSKEELFNEYMKHLTKINKDFKKKNVKEYYVFDEEYAQPIIECNYSENIMEHKLEKENIYLCTMPQIYPEDRGMNYAIKLGKTISEEIKENS